MRHSMRTTLMLTAALLASNGYSAQDWKLITVEEAWRDATTKEKDPRKAQQIFDIDITPIGSAPGHLSSGKVIALTQAIAKIIPKMSILGMGGMDAKNQTRIKRALTFLEYASYNKNQETFKVLAEAGEKATDGSGKIKCLNLKDTLQDLQPLSSDKSLTKQIKNKLISLIENEASLYNYKW